MKAPPPRRRGQSTASRKTRAEALLRQAGVALPGRGLMALAEATQRNLEAHGAAGRTGPFVRGDEATIARDAASLPEPWRGRFLDLGRALD